MHGIVMVCLLNSRKYQVPPYVMGAIFNPWGGGAKRSEGCSLLTLIYVQGEYRPEMLISTLFWEKSV